jgi:hypothetical protein
MILLAYKSCTLWYLYMCLQYILVKFITSIILPLPPFWEQFQQVSFFCFHIWIQNRSITSQSFPSFLCLPLSQWYPSLEKIYFSLLPFIFCNYMYIDSPRGFCLGTSGTHSLSPFSPNIQQLTVQCIISINRCIVSIFFIL